MDLVDEQDGPGAVQRQPLRARGDGRPDVGDAAHDRRQGLNSAPTAAARRRARLVLPVPGGPHSRIDAEVAALHRAAQRSALADEVLLADELGEGPRPHPGRQRLDAGRRLEERVGLVAGGSAGGTGGQSDGSAGGVRSAATMNGRGSA